jgi:hypothetical protein
MVAMTRAEPPRTVAQAALPFGQLTRAAPVAVVGYVGSGLPALGSTIDGALYFVATVALVLAVVAATRGLRRTAPVQQERTFEVLAPQACTLAHDPEDPLSGGTEPVR